MGCVGLKNSKKSLKPVTPKIENIHQAVLAAVSKPKALDMSTWHTCETTHCRAGWVVTLAGKDGAELEKFYASTAMAARMIYRESSPHKVLMKRFYETNDKAMADMKRMAELERDGK
jgi:hypothetical protein